MLYNAGLRCFFCLMNRCQVFAKSLPRPPPRSCTLYFEQKISES